MFDGALKELGVFERVVIWGSSGVWVMEKGLNEKMRQNWLKA